MSPILHDILLYAFYLVAMVSIWGFWYLVMSRLGSF